jgi:hypothetical protein
MSHVRAECPIHRTLIDLIAFIILTSNTAPFIHGFLSKIHRCRLHKSKSGRRTDIRVIVCVQITYHSFQCTIFSFAIIFFLLKITDATEHCARVVTALICVQEVPVSNPGPEIAYPDRRFFRSSRQMPRWYYKICDDRFLPSLS